MLRPRGCNLFRQPAPAFLHPLLGSELLCFCKPYLLLPANDLLSEPVLVPRAISHVPGHGPAKTLCSLWLCPSPLGWQPPQGDGLGDHGWHGPQNTEESRVPGNKKRTPWAPVPEIHDPDLNQRRAWSAGQNRLLRNRLNRAVAVQAFNPSTLRQMQVDL